MGWWSGKDTEPVSRCKGDAEKNKDVEAGLVNGSMDILVRLEIKELAVQAV